ncbi:putative endosomal peripheral membrane protein (Mon2) [Aspergillus melleus]|uniref:putative endosomal peripheral membrane protein (Mon2) n=1 Tax=Aspergillus melleus TaxID=138277 RepID=UPI001E8EE116|nr:Endocytosis and vacuole integrity protein [Aspergillus melleus]KAH8428119.1 Endocytosis and vacuole integrity protein [Aspergillus melleus]
MSSQLLQAELLNLIQESKRKNADLRHAAEESLNELKSLPSTSEAQISADLVRKPKFVDPFILACHARHARLSGIGVICLQRLVASRSLPSQRLEDVLGGLKETTHLSLDIQLKILQTLPALLQHYSDDLGGELLVSTLEICATLQTSKTLALSSTAAATLQQLVVSTFERVSNEDKTLDDAKPTVTVKIDGNPIKIGYFAYDALRVLDDLCRIVDGEQLHFLRIKALSPTFTLELIESVLINSGRLFIGHMELAQVLRLRLMPMIVRFLSERHDFALTVRVCRILLVLLKRHMSLLTAECEMALGLLTHLLEPDGTAPWKRILCMEVFRGLYAEPGLVRLIFSLYDGKDGRKCILKDHMAALVRLSSEKPSLIGVSSRSTVPLRTDHSRSITEEQITLEAGGLAGVIGTSVPSTDASVPGISSQWSVVRTQYLELLDKTEPPSPPETYIYSLVLNCISSFAEGLAKFILPLTVPDLKQKRKNRITGADQNADPVSPISPSHDVQRTESIKHGQKSGAKKSPMPLNPLQLESHPQLGAIKTCAGIIENCWPAVLAACSTFLYASLDDEFYHNLVRSFQKLAHVAGLLRLSTPRDAFLTTLGKATVPAETCAAKPGSVANPTPDEKRKSITTSTLGSPVPDASGAAFDKAPVSLSTRNLLCLRALLNLGIALGPTLDQPAWSIILGTLQDTDLLIGIASTKTNPALSSTTEPSSVTGSDVPKANIGNEIIAVQAASAKLLESTSDYPSRSFQDLLAALLNLSEPTEESDQPATPDLNSSPGRSPHQRPGPMRRNTRRVSLALGKSRIQDEELRFVLEKCNELGRSNLERLSSLEESDCAAWQLLTGRLMSSAADREISQNLRLRANEILNTLIFQTMKQTADDIDQTSNSRQKRNLETLKQQIQLLYDASACRLGSPTGPIIEIHSQSLETLKSILEQYAETFVDGWSIVFDLITSVFGDSGTDERQRTSVSSKDRKTFLLADSHQLIRISYKSLQLIASDFIALLPLPCRLDLVESFSKFAIQQQDFNISLTTTSSFWNVSDFLQGQIERFSIESSVDASVSEDMLVTLAKNEDHSVSRNALWLLLLLRIVDLATDSRSEIRNCAVHTLLRIFDAYGQQLTPKAWRLCLNRVLFQMTDELETELNSAKGTTSPDELSSWVETAVVTIKGFSDLLTNFFEAITKDEEFDQSWKRLLNHCQNLTALHSLELSEAVFTSLSNILLRVQAPHVLSKQSLEAAWLLWVHGHPAIQEDLLDLERPNQDASIAYLKAFQQVYRLYQDEMTNPHVEKILQHIQHLAWNSIFPRYSPDIDRPSSLQALIVDCIRTICVDKEDSQAEILTCLASFADSALSRWSPNSDSRVPTYVAFSKSVIDLLSWYIAEFGIKRQIFANDALSTALEHLANPVSQKYEWPGKDREPSLWRKSTTASLNILKVAIPYVEKQYDESNNAQISRFWAVVVGLTNGIVSAQGYRTVAIPRANILDDETFDVDAFQRLKTLIIPALGASIIADSIRRELACALLSSSFIYLPQRFDLPAKNLETEPLHDFYQVRLGRTFDPTPTSRTKMAYAVMDTLFELASAPAPDQAPSEPHTAARILLARSISPYLILRTAVSLKGYIADQPLRGLMPQPTPARRALLHLLLGMVNLRSEPTAIPQPPTSSSSAKSGDQSHKRHLEWIYPLVVRAVQVAGKEKDDGEVLHALGKVLHEVGGYA